MLAAFKGLGQPVLEITCATKEDLGLYYLESVKTVIGRFYARDVKVV